MAPKSQRDEVTTRLYSSGPWPRTVGSLVPPAPSTSHQAVITKTVTNPYGACQAVLTVREESVLPNRSI